MRDWLNSILGQDGGRAAQLVLALVAVLLLILLVAWIARRLIPGAHLVAAAGGKARKRLGVLEASDVDTRRRLVLVRRDDVEHLIMIGGPNDLLIESRILRGGHAAANRPNIQHMPRPATTDPERFVPSPVTTTPPTGSSTPASAFPTPQTASPRIAQQQGSAPPPSRIVVDEEPELPIEAPVPATPQVSPQFAPPPFVPPTGRALTNPIAPAPPTLMASIDARRPSLSDLLSAATAAKVADTRDLPQPMTAPPPLPRTRAPQPDLEEDDRDMPTQIVAQRTPQPPTAAAPVMPYAEPPASRETEVATQIERALSDLNPLPDPEPRPARVEPRAEVAPLPQIPQPRRPTLEPVQAAMTPPVSRPAPVATTPTMPSIPPRPTPPSRPTLPERPALPERATLAERPSLPERPVAPERPVLAERPALPDRLEPQIRRVPEPDLRTDERAPTGQSAAFTPTLVPEPAPTPLAAPRPITAPVPRPPVAVASEPSPVAPAPAPVAPAKQKTDELEEEMAKLLSELGGSSSR